MVRIGQQSIGKTDKKNCKFNHLEANKQNDELKHEFYYSWMEKKGENSKDEWGVRTKY